jgi:hypothetical protein
MPTVTADPAGEQEEQLSGLKKAAVLLVTMGHAACWRC